MRSDAVEKTEAELVKERAEVLGRAGEALSKALMILRGIEESIQSKLATGTGDDDSLRELNAEISNYNHARENAKMRYYYLIVTREAMGFRRHPFVEEFYKIPPKKRALVKSK
ncbi:MAG: hypothetical protein PHG91_11535 [Syntrophales bacterium]|nr:hypothetical protein [Syntrophales bacterium]MDD5532983.1 hypothetical protein [Syntrophales bacterium]